MARTRRRLLVAAVGVALASVAACDGSRSPARPSSARAGTTATTVTSVAAPAAEEQRLAAETHRLRVTTHPEGATLRIQRVGGAAQVARTPFTGRVKGGHLTLVLSRPGSNTLTQRVLLMTGDPWALRADWPEELRRCPMLVKPFTLDGLAATVRGALAAPPPQAQRKSNGG